jgi:hypothetical protein
MSFVLGEKSTTVFENGIPIDTFDADTKVDSTKEAKKIYGTDESGAPKLYEADEVGGSPDISARFIAEEEEFVIELKNKEGTVLSETKVSLPIGGGATLCYINGYWGKDQTSGAFAQTSQHILNSFETTPKIGDYCITMDFAIGRVESFEVKEFYTLVHCKYLRSVSASLINVTSADRNYFVKQGLVENDLTLTDDETQAARDLIGAVGKTQMATASIAGVVKKAEANEINRFGYNHYIDAYYLPYGVKRCFTNPSTQFPWTEEDKTKALEFLGVMKLIEKLKTDNNLV